jgi:hypothetical protein
MCKGVSNASYINDIISIIENFKYNKSEKTVEATSSRE